MGYSALLFYGYVGVIGLALFAALKWWFKAEVGLAQVWCTYGARPQPLFCGASRYCAPPFDKLMQQGAYMASWSVRTRDTFACGGLQKSLPWRWAGVQSNALRQAARPIKCMV